MTCETYIISDRKARQAATDQIGKLCRLIKACDAMIDEEQRLIGAAIPYADTRYARQWAATIRAAYAVFEADDLHAMAADADPDWVEPVTPIRAGIHAECR